MYVTNDRAPFLSPFQDRECSYGLAVGYLWALCFRTTGQVGLRVLL